MFNDTLARKTDQQLGVRNNKMKESNLMDPLFAAIESAGSKTLD